MRVKPKKLNATLYSLMGVYLAIFGESKSFAQYQPVILPNTRELDENGVDLTTGEVSFSLIEGGIGQGDRAILYKETWISRGIVDNIAQFLKRSYNDGSIYITVGYEGGSSLFERNYDGSMVLNGSPYGTLEESSDRRSYIYRNSAGDRYEYGPLSYTNSNIACSSDVNQGGECALFLSKIRRADGIETKYVWNTSNYGPRLESVCNNIGYCAKIKYKSDNAENPYSNTDFWDRTRVDFYNYAYSKGAVSTITPASQIRPDGNGRFYSKSSIVDSRGSKWNVDWQSGGVVKIDRPDVQGYSRTYEYQNTWDDISNSYKTVVTSINDNGQYSDYKFQFQSPKTKDENGDYSVDISSGTVSIKKMYFLLKFYGQDIIRRPKSFTDKLDRRTAFEWADDSLVRSVENPEGGKTIYTYDGRQNVNSLSVVSKSDGNDRRETKYGYSENCENLVICNLPSYYRDPRSSEWKYEYAPEHGGLVREIFPSVSGTTKIIRHKYAQRYAWLVNDSGGYTKSSSPVWLKVEDRVCMKSETVGDSCADGASDEVITSYEYGQDDGMSGNDLSLRGIAVTSKGETRRTCYGYDLMGNRISETKPNAGLGVCP